MERIRITNWEEFQHYKDRDPPWIKLHNHLLINYEFRCLQDASKLLLILLWLVRSRLEGDIPADPTYLKEMTGYKAKINLKPLLDKGLIECYQDASSVRASCAPETEAETETETYTVKGDLATLEQQNFEKARVLYPGKKRGFKSEFENFCVKHKDWRELLDDDGLERCVQTLITRKAYSDGFWPMFQTFCNQSRYEEALT